MNDDLTNKPQEPILPRQDIKQPSSSSIPPPPPVPPPVPPQPPPPTNPPPTPPQNQPSQQPSPQADMGDWDSSLRSQSLPSLGPQPQNSQLSTQSGTKAPLNTPPPKPLHKSQGFFTWGKLLVLFIIITIFFFGTAGIALGYNDYKIISPPKLAKVAIDSLIVKTPLPKTPRLILSQTERSMAKLKTATLETQFEFKTEHKDFPLKNAKITLKGPVDFKATNQSRSQFDISGQVATEGIQLSAAGSVKLVDNTLFFKLTEVPAGSFLPLDDFKDQWFFIKLDNVQSPEDLEKNRQITQKLKEIFDNFIARASDWTTSEKDEEDLYILKVAPPEDEIDNLAFDVVAAIEPKHQTTLENSIEKDNLKEFTNNLKKVEMTLKIDKGSYTVSEYALAVSLEIPAPTIPKSSKQVTLSPTSTVPITFSTTAKFSEFNQPIVVDIPVGAKDISLYVGEIEKSLRENPSLSPLPAPSPPAPSDNSKPKEPQSGFRQLLDGTSPVLGEKTNYWDLAILQSILMIVAP